MAWKTRYSLMLLGGVALAIITQAADSPPNSPFSGFQGYANASAFTVAPRPSPLPNYPCSMCHQFRTPDPTPRPLEVKHPELDHGKGDIWCTACHSQQQPDLLINEAGQPVAYDDVYLVCGRCHGNKRKDWYFGVHGKRVANWQGERELYNCVRCHNPHQPAIQPRKPQPPPPVRAGLEHQQGSGHDLQPVWERHEDQTSGGSE
jgi:hypothetical protein